MKQGKWFAIIGMVILLVILGAYREIIFVNVNEQMLFNDGHIEDYRVLDSFAFLKDFDNSALSNMKWGLTVGFSFSFLLLGFISLRSILRDPEGARWLAITYLGALILSGVAFFFGKLIGQQELGYSLSRVFMGALQSPFILMLMIPARMLAKRM